MLVEATPAVVLTAVEVNTSLLAAPGVIVKPVGLDEALLLFASAATVAVTV
jgi:hypothetical protein